MEKLHSVSRFNQKTICPKCDAHDAIFEDQLKTICKGLIETNLRNRRFADQIDFALKTI
tara:strand:- start:6034 stop:6210 length:177 start_codon:yes stop_codon:yes gene_type:complete